ncbi:bifunctional lysylphosphatidylglycerol flippase/synthetase MprF [Ciceribacter ferrooxidans]|uniref:Phosphatidylglycerol lysyltransferase n=1 Tax=Ciceribacter ferrooxidans TaxID=2509717 RepID=A0A4V1RQA0_9HYPH|nr:bifunctional lysylphosphatidylglycerol flippase/synthetase MprF [Ciceribacter ferrooxidans]RYC12127.1 bifunctional lysylphosphatidylglycerol flippase/synthetase MprF [Ciceribacter ferrooxidans]
MLPDSETHSGASRLLSRYRGYLTAAAVVAVFTMMIFAIHRLTAEVRYDDVLTALGDTSWWSLLWAAFFTALSYGALALYDANAIDYIGRKLPLPSVVTTAFIAYAVGNTAGFGPLSGGAIRYRAYSKLGLQPGEIARVIAFVTLSFGLGLAAVSALALLVVAPRIADIVGLNGPALRFGAVAVVVLLAVLVFLGRNGREITIAGVTLRLPDTRTSSRQFLVTAFDLAGSASALYVLLPETHVGWPAFFAIYATAVVLGVLSHVPAGLGVFETVMIAGLGNTISADQLLGSLVLYRLVYYVLPLLLALALAVVGELRSFAKQPLAAEIVQIAARLVPALLSTYALMLGAMLIFSSVTPTPDGDLDFLAGLLPLPIVEAAHFLSSILGLVLVVASRGIAQRLDGAWWVGLAAAAIAFLFSLMKALAVFEAIALGLFIAAMLASAASFTRHASLFGQALGPAWLTAMAVTVVGAAGVLLFVYRDTQYSRELWWQFEFSEEAPRSLRALLGLAISSAVVAMFSLLRPVAHRPDEAREDDLARAVAIVEDQNVADANLVRMGDKRLLFSQSGKAFIMYGIQGRSWIALADPVGADEDFADLVWQFVDMARASGGRAVFYQITPALLPSCIDAGLRAFKLGELATVDLGHFDLASSRLAGLRQSYNRGQRDGLVFSIVEPPDVPPILGELKAISDAWLAHHNTREKSFSLGAFDPGYVLTQPVAILTKDDRIVAFATVMTTATKSEATVDLMRFAPDAPRGAMDFLFISLMKHMREAGFSHFNLGMAPLSGMSRRETAPVWDRIGGLVFEHGERFYNFKGLRAFKSKFHPQWEPRYLAVTNGTGAALALMDITFLISGGMKGVVAK